MKTGTVVQHYVLYTQLYYKILEGVLTFCIDFLHYDTFDTYTYMLIK